MQLDPTTNGAAASGRAAESETVASTWFSAERKVSSRGPSVQAPTPAVPVVMDAATLATIAIDPATTGPVAANSPVGTVVATVTIEVNGQRVNVSDLPLDQQAQIGLAISGGNGAYALNAQGQIVVADPSLLNFDRLDRLKEAAIALQEHLATGYLNPEIFIRQMEALRAARVAADPTELTLEVSYGGSVVSTQTVTLDMIGGRGLVETPVTQPEPPCTLEEIEAIRTNGSTYFFEILAQQPPGSPGAILYNLFRARSINDLPEFAGKVDIAAVEADIQAYMSDPAIIALMGEAQDMASLQQTGKTSKEMAAEMSAYLLDEETIAWMQTLTPEEREKFISDRVHEIAFFDPALAQSTLESLTGAIIQFEMDTKTLADYAPAEVESAVSSVFQAAIIGNRFGVGLLGVGAGALGELSAAEYQEAVAAYSAHLQAGGTPGSFRGSTAAEGLTANTKAALYEFSDALNASGAAGAVGSVLAAIAVYQDFSDGRFPDTPMEILNTTADLMSVVGGLPGAKKAFEFLGIDTATQSALHSVTERFGISNAINPGALEEAIGDVDLRDPTAVYNEIVNDADALAGFATDAEGNLLTEAETLAAVTQYSEDLSVVALQYHQVDGALYDSLLPELSDAGSEAALLPGEVETAGSLAWDAFSEAGIEMIPLGESAGVAVAAGESAEMANLRAGLLAGMAGADAEISVTSAARFGAFFEGLSVLGAAAELFYGVESFAAAEAAFASGDTLAGWLNVGAGLSFEVSGAAGIGAFIGATWGVAALSGPLLPFVALGAGLAAFGFVLGGYFHAKHQHDQQISELDDFLTFGVGNGKDYYLNDPDGPTLTGGFVPN